MHSRAALSSWAHCSDCQPIRHWPFLVLSKRVRELALGLPGLFVSHWMEEHLSPRRSVPTHANNTYSSEVNLASSLGDHHRLTSVTRVVKVTGSR